MFPQPELIELAARKAALLDDIGRRRHECVRSVVQLTRPLAHLDTALQLARRLAPLASLGALPLAALCQQKFFPRQRLLAAALRWGPLAFRAVTQFRAGISASAMRNQPESTRPRAEGVPQATENT
jgi:hypothetical protein